MSIFGNTKIIRSVYLNKCLLFVCDFCVFFECIKASEIAPISGEGDCGNLCGFFEDTVVD